ncbi:trehalase [Candidatus Roizmanbacteria bacterium]|nr:trehalase [Candidatus Roizmanbacteria bacterium]
MKYLNLSSYPQLHGTLFEETQLAQVLGDGITFVDAVPNRDPELILARYLAEKDQVNFNHLSFITEEFTLPNQIYPPILIAKETPLSMYEYISKLWHHLYRKQTTPVAKHDTFIPLPHSYIVPGGRFRSIYYWDSYFTALGLVRDGLTGIVIEMCDNFVHLLEEIGYIPNGNRVYLASRSQPPFFALMVQLLADYGHKDLIPQYLPYIEKEYEYWMSKEFGHAVTGNGATLNRYYDQLDTPRPESHKEDVELAKGLSSEERPAFYRHIRSAAESGWDFSSRWCKIPGDLRTIYATDILPVDLNCLIAMMEERMGRWFSLVGQSEKSAFYTKKAASRKESILRIFWSAEQNFFMDYDLSAKKHTPCFSLAATLPLFAGIATPDQARIIAEKLNQDFLKRGGLVTTLNTTKEQWDSPNGWAPLQYFAYIGLKNYGFAELADEIARRFTQTCLDLYKETGTIFEKYNVVDELQIADGGEYSVQTGFGWTNGVLMALR